MDAATLRQKIAAYPEAKIVTVADMLDKFGPIGVYQITRVFTEFNAGYADTIDAIDNPKRRFETVTGEKLSAERKPFTNQFIHEFRKAYELYGEESS